VVVASGGTTIRTPVKEISSQGRAATGVRIMSMDDGQVVASAALVLSHDEA
jgi:DNA gyrase subunit A